jgi:hypothetical protein
MAELLTAAERASVAADLLDLHDTFGRDIVVYKEAQKVVVSTDPNFNYLYGTGGASTTSVENIPVKKIFKARIKYDSDRSLENFGEAGAQIKVSRPDGGSLVRIKLKVEDYSYIKEAKRIELDGRMFHVDSDPRAHGLFDTIQFYTLFLRPIE